MAYQELGRISPDDFVHVDPKKGTETPGRIDVANFKFDPDACIVSISGLRETFGWLTVEQEGVNFSLHYHPDEWKRPSLPQDES